MRMFKWSPIFLVSFDPHSLCSSADLMLSAAEMENNTNGDGGTGFMIMNGVAKFMIASRSFLLSTFTTERLRKSLSGGTSEGSKQCCGCVEYPG